MNVMALWLLGLVPIVLLVVFRGAISSLTTSLSAGLSWSASNNVTGTDYQPVTSSGNIRKLQANGTAAANAALAGSDQLISYVFTITAASSSTIDLTSLTNVLQQTGVSLARIKGFMLRLLDSSDDATNGTACSKIAVTNDVTLPNALNHATGSGLTIAVTVTTTTITGASIGAAGTGYPPSSTFPVTVNQSGGSGGVISVTTNSGGVPTSVAIAAAGTGYSAATLDTTVLGRTVVKTGGVLTWFDRLAAGVLAGSTTKNIKIVNMDGSLTAAVQLSVIGGST